MNHSNFTREISVTCLGHEGLKGVTTGCLSGIAKHMRNRFIISLEVTIMMKQRKEEDTLQCSWVATVSGRPTRQCECENNEER